MDEPPEELEPLFDYSRVQPIDFVYIDDDCLDLPPVLDPKRKRNSSPTKGGENENCKVVKVADDGDNEEDWLPPPPKNTAAPERLSDGDATIMELRLKKQELASFAQSAEDVLREVEAAAKREVSTSAKPEEGDLSKPREKREKVLISIQDKDGLKQFRMYMDDKFERLFKMYAENAKSSLETLCFSFDGDKVSSMSTPENLGMENEDIIEVHQKAA